jgi:hypothetical protein
MRTGSDLPFSMCRAFSSICYLVISIGWETSSSCYNTPFTMAASSCSSALLIIMVTLLILALL